MASSDIQSGVLDVLSVLVPFNDEERDQILDIVATMRKSLAYTRQEQRTDIYLEQERAKFRVESEYKPGE